MGGERPMPHRRQTWIALFLVNALACFGEPPPVGGPDPETSTSAGGTTGASSSQPLLDSGAEGDDDDASTTDGPATSLDPDEAGESHDSAETIDPDGGETTTGASASASASESASESATDSESASESADGSSDGGESTTGEAVWTCYFEFYDADDGCDCGCGIIDPDCADATVASCEYCSGVGSCGDLGGCPSKIDPVNNATCLD